MVRYPMHINGQTVSGDSYPATGHVVGSVPAARDHDVDHAIVAARAAQSGWAALSSAQRAELLHQIGDRFEQKAERIASLITQEQGKPLSGPAQCPIWRLRSEHLSGRATPIEPLPVLRPLSPCTRVMRTKLPWG